MEDKELQKRLPTLEESPPVSLSPPANSSFRIFAAFLICSALLIAVFSASAVLLKGRSWGDGNNRFPFLQGDSAKTPNGDSLHNEDSTMPLPSPEGAVPDGAIPILSKDLSYLELGSAYFHNETPYTPNPTELLTRELLVPEPGGAPRVLILHTHTSESYLEEGSTYLEGAPGDLTYTRDEAQNVLAVGKMLADTLNENGITAIHCTVMHDAPTLGGSYERSAQTVRQYLKEYPTITYVIDLHRDAVMTSEGEYVRTKCADESTAQIMAVVGSDCNGTGHPNWEENLALAFRLRQALNQKIPNVCRPVSLRNASYNQELAPRFLLLEIGSGGNSVEEAKNAARLVGQTLAEMLYAR